ncbi:hypothetical protein [Mycolicibacterium vaccae]|uniref:Transmembrane protein n=1 Tax=Mycolicibacterium vaccae ATCC 25954 TaxID=1194972 RepID=K0UYF4_MYCVA|nr:hypothetical protein [Mycolicibacterium vaccae]ANI38146.1 hypothetical protein MYVA_0909 [Mycolicibacterium vaccae 95051]EJZ12167.1 hypothetical protein MVAC_02886 [Mycolicibacterium vaccae ATCC 25954]MCV7060958.1 hypothetical protein [Mycolicibacterium vaccae]
MIDWTRAALIGALAGAVFWAVTVYVLIASDGAPAVWAAVAIAGIALLAAGVLLYRRGNSTESRCRGAALALAPLTGIVPVAVFSAAGLLVEVGASV